MTRNQRDLWLFIQQYQTQNGGVSPSFEEMRAGMSLASKSQVSSLLAGLERSKAATRSRRCARAIHLRDPHFDLSSVPDEVLLAEALRRRIARAA